MKEKPGNKYIAEVLSPVKAELTKLFFLGGRQTRSVACRYQLKGGQHYANDISLVWRGKRQHYPGNDPADPGSDRAGVGAA